MAQKLTPEAIDAIVESVERGASLREAAYASKFTQDQVDDWFRIAREGAYRNGIRASAEQLRSVTELTERARRAIAKRYTVLTSNLYHNGTTLNAKTGWYDAHAIDKLLSKSPDTRDAWYERREHHETRVLELHPAHQLVRELSTADLEALEQKMLGAGDSSAI